MRVYNIKDDKIITETEFKRLFPNTRFPANLRREFLQKRGCDIVVEADHPEYDNDLEYLESGAGELRSDGYHNSWVVKSKNISLKAKQDILEARKAAEAIRIEHKMERAIDEYIDSVAKAKGYDNRITAALRAGYENPWQVEGIAFGKWMDSVYLHCQQIRTTVLDKGAAVPSIDELIAGLPKMVWPK